MNIVGLIQTGRENAISMASLAAVLGCSERRARKFVHDACIAGAPICGDECGYYLPANLYEAKRAERIRLARAASSRQASRGMRAFIEAAEAAESGQLSVLDFLTVQEKAANGVTSTGSGKENV